MMKKRLFRPILEINTTPFYDFRRNGFRFGPVPDRQIIYTASYPHNHSIAFEESPAREPSPLRT